jgi:hypothetical protein
MVGDFFTKPLQGKLFYKFRALIMNLQEWYSRTLRIEGVCWKMYLFIPDWKSIRWLRVFKIIRDSNNLFHFNAQAARILISIVFFLYPKDLNNDPSQTITFIQ